MTHDHDPTTTRNPHNHATVGESGQCPECRAKTIALLADAPDRYLVVFFDDAGEREAIAIIPDYAHDPVTAAWAVGANTGGRVASGLLPPDAVDRSAVPMCELIYEPGATAAGHRRVKPSSPFQAASKLSRVSSSSTSSGISSTNPPTVLTCSSALSGSDHQVTPSAISERYVRQVGFGISAPLPLPANGTTSRSSKADPTNRADRDRPPPPSVFRNLSSDSALQATRRSRPRTDATSRLEVDLTLLEPGTSATHRVGQACRSGPVRGCCGDVVQCERPGLVCG
jgi:hypothetical protein